MVSRMTVSCGDSDEPLNQGHQTWQVTLVEMSNIPSVLRSIVP
jgi:hypothetical protein